VVHERLVAVTSRYAHDDPNDRSEHFRCPGAARGTGRVLTRMRLAYPRAAAPEVMATARRPLLRPPTSDHSSRRGRCPDDASTESLMSAPPRSTSPASRPRLAAHGSQCGRNDDPGPAGLGRRSLLRFRHRFGAAGLGEVGS
jgi:hypothetical protein